MKKKKKKTTHTYKNINNSIFKSKFGMPGSGRSHPLEKTELIVLPQCLLEKSKSICCPVNV